MAIIEQSIQYFDQDKRCIGHLVYDDTFYKKKPCVLINHAWGGLDQFSKNKALEISKHGYIGFCLDNYGEGYEPISLEEKQNNNNEAQNTVQARSKVLHAPWVGPCAPTRINTYVHIQYPNYIFILYISTGILIL